MNRVSYLQNSKCPFRCPLAWRECCVIGRAWLTRAYNLVSLLTDS